MARVQATLQKRILRAFVGRSLLESCDAKVEELHLTLLELIDRIKTEDRAKR